MIHQNGLRNKSRRPGRMVACIGIRASWKRLRFEGWTRAAGAQYTSGIYFVVMIDGNGGWSLGFAHESWKLTHGRLSR